MNADRGERIIEPKDTAATIKRFVAALGRRAAEADPEALKLFAEIRAAVDNAERSATQAQLDQGYSYREISKALGLKSSGAIHNRMRRAETPRCA